jgi:hypothetical protein
MALLSHSSRLPDVYFPFELSHPPSPVNNQIIISRLTQQKPTQTLNPKPLLHVVQNSTRQVTSHPSSVRSNSLTLSAPRNAPRDPGPTLSSYLLSISPGASKNGRKPSSQDSAWPRKQASFVQDPQFTETSLPL